MRVALFSTLWIAAAVAVAPATAERGTRVFVEPREVAPIAGESRLILVQVEGVPAEGLVAFQVTLRFDPRRIEVRDPNAGFGVPAFAPLGGSPLCPVVRQRPACPDPEWMLPASGRLPMGTHSNDARQGLVTIAYGTSGNAPPVAGDGTLAVIEVVGQGRGRGEIEIVDALLLAPSEPPRRYPLRSIPERRTNLRRGLRHEPTN